MKKEGKVIPTNTLFLTFNQPDMPKEIKVGDLTVKVDPFVTNLLRRFNCKKFGTQASVAKQQQNINGVGKTNMKSSVMDPKYALTAMVLTLHLLKIARYGRRRRRFNAFALKNASPFLKLDSW